MMWLRIFLFSIVGTFSSPNYYLTLKNKSWSSSFVFFLITQLCMGIILSWAIIQVNFPKYQDQIIKSIQELVTYYPANLEIQWDQNQLTINQSDPVVVNYPSQFPRSNDLPEKVAILLPQETGEQVPNNLPNSALFVVNQKQLFLTDLQGGWSHLPLQELPGFEQPFTLNQDSMPSFKSELIKVSTQVLNGMARVLPFLLPIIIVVTQFFDSLFYALIAFFGLRILIKQVSFKKVWQITLHLSVVSFALSQVAAFLYPKNEIALYPLCFWILFILVVWSYLKSERQI